MTSLADLSLARELLPGAVLIAIVSFISSFASAKKCALKGNYHVDACSELVGLGLANAGSALSGGVPVQIGLSRSGLAMGMGVKTQLGAGVFVALTVGSIILVVSSWLYYVPRCVLSSIIVSAALHLFEFDQARELYSYASAWRDRADFGVWIVAFVLTVALGAFYGICITCFISLALVVYRVAEPPFEILGARPAEGLACDEWVSLRECPDAKQKPGILVCRLEGPMFYANSERFQDQIDRAQLEAKACGDPVSAIVFDCSSLPFIDATAVQVLKEVVTSCKGRGVRFYIAGADAHGAHVLIDRVLGKLVDHAPNADVADLRLPIVGCVLSHEMLGPLSRKKAQGDGEPRRFPSFHKGLY